MKDIEINGVKETIVERSDYPVEECKNILGQEVTAILGYGPQGRGPVSYTHLTLPTIYSV